MGIARSSDRVFTTPRPRAVDSTARRDSTSQADTRALDRTASPPGQPRDRRDAAACAVRERRLRDASCDRVGVRRSAPTTRCRRVELDATIARARCRRSARCSRARSSRRCSRARRARSWRMRCASRSTRHARTRPRRQPTRDAWARAVDERARRARATVAAPGHQRDRRRAAHEPRPRAARRAAHRRRSSTPRPVACNLEYDLEQRRARLALRALRRRCCASSPAPKTRSSSTTARRRSCSRSTRSPTGREAIVSRGELIEIGGSFRVPDIMAKSGATLVEVGTTNRTHLADYDARSAKRPARSSRCIAATSSVRGFVAEADAARARAARARRTRCRCCSTSAAGCCSRSTTYGLRGEPTARDARARRRDARAHERRQAARRSAGGHHRRRRDGGRAHAARIRSRAPCASTS